MTNIHKNQVDTNVTVATQLRTMGTYRLTQRGQITRHLRDFPEQSFLGLVTISIISPGVNVARTKTRNGAVRRLERRLALGLWSEKLARMSGVEADSVL